MVVWRTAPLLGRQRIEQWGRVHEVNAPSRLHADPALPNLLFPHALYVRWLTFRCRARGETNGGRRLCNLSEWPGDSTLQHQCSHRHEFGPRDECYASEPD